MNFQSKDTFLFIHGAWHGGWCWEKIEPSLQTLGYTTIAPDLPGHGSRHETISSQTLESYAADVVKILTEQEEPVILVGHSMGGAVITVAAEKCPEKVKKLVYLAAFMLQPGQSVNGLHNGIRPIDLVARSQDGKTVPWAAPQIERFTVDCPVAIREQLYPRLCAESIDALSTGVDYTADRWGKIRRFFIACDDDMAATPEAVTQMLSYNPCEAVYNLHADHLVFYSAPEALVEVLDAIANL